MTITNQILRGPYQFDPEATGDPGVGEIVLVGDVLKIAFIDNNADDHSTAVWSTLTPTVCLDSYLGQWVSAVVAPVTVAASWWALDLDTSHQSGQLPTLPSIVTVSGGELGTAPTPGEAPVDTTIDTIRYTSLAFVKDLLGVPSASTTKDDRITQAIVAAEVQIDVHLGRAFYPSEVPIPIQQAAAVISMAVYKAGDSATGSMGSDDWLGTIDVSDEVRREFQRNAMLVGYRIAWGIA